MEDTTLSSENKLFSAVLRLNAKMLGMALGLLFGFAIFFVTNWLIITGGHITPSGEYVVGPHLQLLSQFFIGYKVSFLGSFVGFAYGFAVGTVSGAFIGWIYNKIVYVKNGKRE